MNYNLYTPLEEFQIRELFTVGLFSNTVSWSVTEMLAILILIYIWVLEYDFTHWRWTYTIYSVLQEIVISGIGVYSIKSSIVILTLFVYIYISNIWSLVCYTSMVSGDGLNNLVMSVGMMLYVSMTGIRQYRWKVLKLFIGSNIPWLILPLMFVIELISYLSRVVSLAIRLTANILGSLVMLKLIGSIVVLMISCNIYLINICVIGIMIAIYILELGVTYIQAYVYCILSGIYIKDIYLLL